MMEPECVASSSEFDFGFAFNDSKFSDRVLQLELIADPVDAPPDSDSATAIADCASHGKRKRPNDGEAASSNDLNWTTDCSAATVVRVETLHISSPILAAKSPFFYKLFSNGMSESEQRHVTLKINASEEAAFMALLNFMYSNTLKITAAPALLDLLMAADKFGVSSCITNCIRLLLNTPMTTDSALLYLELPHTLLMVDALQPLTDAAKQYLADRYKDITKFQEEVMALPLTGIEAILASDDLQITSEDAVYDFVLKWAKQHYKRREGREILGTRLVPLIRFPYMTCRKLKKVLTCDDFKHHEASKQLVIEALFFKAETAEESASLNHCRFVERAYTCRPVKVVRFELPQPRCVVYLYLKREECASLFPSSKVNSQTFHFGGQRFFLSARCITNIHGSSRFGLYLKMWKKRSSTSFSVDCEFAAMSKPTEDFVSRFKLSHTFPPTGGQGVGVGVNNFCGTSWNSFMAEDSLFFIKDVLHLRIQLTIRH